MMIARAFISVTPAQAGAQPVSRKGTSGLDVSLRWHDGNLK